jgi:tetratricopeptide (TPR) repeat protein
MFLTAILSILLIIGILTFAVRFYKSFSEFTKINSERHSLQEKINFWQSVANKYEGYKDAYFQIAILEYRLGNFNKAQEYNKKTLLLDPNFEDSKKLEVLLEER